MWFQPSRLNPLTKLRAHREPAGIPMASAPKGGWSQHDAMGTGRGVAPQTQQPSRASQWLVEHAKPVRMGLAAVAGAGITAGTTYAVVHHVQHLITTAHVSSDPAVWSTMAQTKIYDPCYNGCNDCGDINYAYNACQRTAALNLTGVICDGNAMWNWLERYPAPCLEALGDVLKASALANVKQHGRDQLALIILTVLAGVVGGVVVYKVAGCAAARLSASRTQTLEAQRYDV